MNNVARLQYLHRMGVTAWRLRHQVVSSCAGFVYTIQTAQQRIVIIAVCDQDHSAEQQLLEKICQAFGGNFSGQYYPDVRQHVVTADRQIILGQDFAKHLDVRDPSCIVTHSLNAMLVDPTLKREVWQKIR